MIRPVVNRKSIKQVKRRIAEDGVELSIVTVDILKTAAAAAASIPVLGAAADIVSRILNQISQAQQNTELALRIATHCARVLATISEHLYTLENTLALSDSINQFVMSLREVQDFIKGETNRNIFYLFFFAKRRAGQFQDLQLKITTLLTLYDVVQRTVRRYPGYRREEATLRPVLPDCKVITHATPSVHEKCLIWRKDVDLFSGKHGQRISPAVKSTKCSVQGHRHCNDQSCASCVPTVGSSYSYDNSGIQNILGAGWVQSGNSFIGYPKSDHTLFQTTEYDYSPDRYQATMRNVSRWVDNGCKSPFSP
ncbi:hypothetical protein ARMGADRAFT_1168615 [Armillaria gallica]|uniref:Uncharacterized protein n=1 Tax=Armillaria gallica TaxID=47427 RepID=A0A2H3DIH4_ARMGA|nr:hypothetical protein ARMGADRAFT_1168615 [Armillaria gallica]